MRTFLSLNDIMEHPSGESRFEKLLFEKTQMLRQDSTAKQSAASMSLGSADSALDSEKVPTEQVSSMKRPSSDLADDIHCTCAISSQCELAAKNGLRDCRTLVAPKRRKVTKPRLPYDTRSASPLIFTSKLNLMLFLAQRPVHLDKREGQNSEV